LNHAKSHIASMAQYSPDLSCFVIMVYVKSASSFRYRWTTNRT